MTSSISPLRKQFRLPITHLHRLPLPMATTTHTLTVFHTASIAQQDAGTSAFGLLRIGARKKCRGLLLFLGLLNHITTLGNSETLYLLLIVVLLNFILFDC